MYLAVDIGTNSIKILEKDDTGKVLKWGRLERKQPFQTNITPLDEKAAVYFSKSLLELMKAESGEAVVVLPDFLFYTMIADDPDIRQIPAAPETFHFQAFALPSLAGQAGKFLLVAIPKDIVEKYIGVFSGLGIKIRSIELQGFVLARVFGKSQNPTLVVDIGERRTSFVVAKDGFPNFIARTDFGMASKAPDVIMNKVKEIAGAYDVKNIFYTCPLDIVNGI